MHPHDLVIGAPQNVCWQTLEVSVDRYLYRPVRDEGHMVINVAGGLILLGDEWGRLRKRRRMRRVEAVSEHRQAMRQRMAQMAHERCSLEEEARRHEILEVATRVHEQGALYGGPQADEVGLQGRRQADERIRTAGDIMRLIEGREDTRAGRRRRGDESPLASQSSTLGSRATLMAPTSHLCARGQPRLARGGARGRR